MTVRIIKILSLALLLFSCSTKKSSPKNNIPAKKSRVADFHYGGYGDTLYATLNGEVYQLDTTIKTRDSLIPLSNVSIKIEAYNKTVFTDSSGSFTINLDKGVFSLLVAKENYQPLRMKNYVSDPDQYSGTTIYLEPGNELQTFEIPTRERN